MLSEIMLALRHALRSLRRNPTFAATVILTFAVGIGATTAIFGVISTALLSPLPYPAADRLLLVQQTRKDDPISVSYLDFLDFRSQSSSFKELAGFVGQSFTLTGAGEPERLRGQVVTSNLFRTLGVHPLIGREFTAEDDQLGATPSVEISHDLWQRRFGGDRAVIGKAVPIDGRAYTVIGVMPEGFHFPDGLVFDAADLWAPFSLIDKPDRENRDSHPGIVAIGQLAPGRTLASAREDLSSIATRLASTYPESNRAIGVKTDAALDVLVGSLRESLLLLFVAAALVLLIACANVSGLVLTRAAGRRREVAVRAALGASPLRMVANLIGEGALLALFGGVAGLALAAALIRVFASTVGSLPRLGALSLDWRPVVFAAVLTVVVGLLASVAPAAWAGRADLDRWLRTRGADGGGSGVRSRHVLIVGEVALSLVLLSVSVLLLRSFEQLRADSGGIDPHNVLTFSLRLPDSGYVNRAQKASFFAQASQGFAALPGVLHVGATTILPYGGAGAQSGIALLGGGKEAERRTDVQLVTPDYFSAMGITLTAGRALAEMDDERAVPVAVVDERLAAANWPGESAVGKHVEGWGFRDLAVVGVVRHVKNYGVAAESRQEMYVPYALRPVSRLTFALRTSGDPRALVAGVRRVVTALDPNIPVYALRSMDDVVAQTVAGPRLSAFLAGAYSAVALLLAVIGIYGVIAYLVLRRTQEFGVRLALGARSSSVTGLVMRQTVRLVGTGIGIGAIAAFASARLLRGMLFGVAASDPWIVAGSAGVLLLTAMMASAIPALRAGCISPLLALRDD